MDLSPSGKASRMSTPKRLISDLSNKFTSSSVDKKKHDPDKENSAAEARRLERETKRAEEDKKYKGMKPIQAMFSKAIAARSSESRAENKPIVSSVSVSEMKDKVRRKSLINDGSIRNSVDLDFIPPDLPVISALDVYTKGNCKTLTNKFETDIKLKKSMSNHLEFESKPFRRTTSTLPDMFEQQKKRDESLYLNKVKDTGIINKESINDCMDRFEVSESRRQAKEKMIELTKKQKNLAPPKWNDREKEKIECLPTETNQKEAFITQKREFQSNQETPKATPTMTRRDSIKRKDSSKQSPEPAEQKEEKYISKKQSEKTSDDTLPSISTSTFSDMKRKLQEKTLDTSSKPKTYKPIRKLSLNQFEEYSKKNNSTVTSPNSIISNVPKLSDIKKRFVHDKKDAPTSYVAFKSKKAKVEPEDTGNSAEKNIKVSLEESSPSAEPNEALDPLSNQSADSLINTEQVSEKRSSKSQMQNYLLSKVLFDNNNNNRQDDNAADENEVIEMDFIDDTPIDVMSDPYFQEIEKYLSLIGGGTEDKKKTKAKKVSGEKKTKKRSLKLKVVELDDLKNKFEGKKDTNVHLSSTSPAISSNILLDKRVNKYKEKFESSMEKDVKSSNVVRRRSGVISSDLLCKFDSPEELERLKKQREEEREARRLSRLKKLEEEQKRLEEEARRERERLEAERLENERLKEEERERLAEEARIAVACEEMMKNEREKAEARRKREEAAKSKREKNEPALKKKKVLGRIQHIFEKEADSNPSARTKFIGSIKDKAEELFQSKSEESGSKTPFQDSSLTGMSVNRFKDKFELSKNEEPLHLYTKSEKKKRVPLQTAIDFDNLVQEAQVPPESSTPSQNSSEQWSWKKKDQGQLAVETTMALIKTNAIAEKKTSRPSRSCRRSSDTTDELLKELHSTSKRLAKKDAIQEHEMKMKEYEEFIDEIQSFLNEPIRDISDCLDEVRKEKKNKKVKPKKVEKSSKQTEKEKQFKELIQFIKNKDHFIPPSMSHQIREGMEYKEFIKVIESFLNSPDKSVEEIEFKDRIETFLDSIDDEPTSGEKGTNDRPDITSSCVLSKGSSLLPDVVEGGLRSSRRRSLVDSSSQSINRSSSIADFQNELKKYRSLLDGKASVSEVDSKWKIGKVDSSFLQNTNEDDKVLDGKRMGPPSEYAKQIQSKLVASIQKDSNATPNIPRNDKKKIVLQDAFIPKSDEVVRGMKDLRQFIYKHRSDLPIDVLDFDCSDKDLISKVRAFAFSDEDKPLKEEIKIYLELAGGTSSSLTTDSIKTDHVADMKKKIFESKNEENELLYSAPRRKLRTLETSTSTSSIPISRKSTDGKSEWSRKLSTRSVNPTPSPPVQRALSKSASDAAVFRHIPEVRKAPTHIDPKEREAAILAKYGVKPRPALRDSESSSSSESESEEEEDIKKIISQDPRLQSIYGDRLLSSEDIPRKSRRDQEDSLNSLRNILGAMRQPQVLKTNSSQNIKKVFENTEESQRKSVSNVQRSTSFANIKNFISDAQNEDANEDTRPSWQYAPSGLSRSSSFHKFKSAIQKAEEESSQSSNSNAQVQAELDAIRSSSRLQKMFAINKPSEGVSRSRSNSAIEATSEVPIDISQARENIRSAFESTHAKMSYGVKLRNEKPKVSPKPQPQSTTAGKKWIYETINKYFDVIVEDDESDDAEDAEEDSSSESEEDYESCSEESDLEISDFSTIISSRNNYSLKRTKSSVKLRSMLSSLMVEKSISVDSVNTFKANLNSHLQKSKSNVSNK